MNTIDVLPLLLSLLYVCLCPFTKVEESFNVQAAHDLLYEGPGRLEKNLGDFFMITTCCQFHLPFYMSRTLPNTFGLFLVLVAFGYLLKDRWRPASAALAAATLIFRCDTLLLCIPVAIQVLATRRATILEFVAWGAVCGLSCVALTVAIDSYFWGRWLWPEGEVFWFNTILNQSSKWGTESYHWYFSNALPRGLLGAALLVPVGLTRPAQLFRNNDYNFSRADALRLFDIDALKVFVLPTTFVLLYSILPHKELRFIMPVFPIFNGLAALGMAKIWNLAEETSNDKKAVPRRRLSKTRALVGRLGRLALIVLMSASTTACSVFFGASYWNYPGGHALVQLHQEQAIVSGAQPRLVHIDVTSAMTGVSRFVELGRDNDDDAWSYSKAEHLNDASDYQEFTHLLTAEPDRHRERFDEIAAVEGFDRVDWKARRLVTSPKIFIMGRRLDEAS
eukprot:g1032.t1